MRLGDTAQQEISCTSKMELGRRPQVGRDHLSPGFTAGCSPPFPPSLYQLASLPPLHSLHSWPRMDTVSLSPAERQG
jgi:hypothetical protein